MNQSRRADEGKTVVVFELETFTYAWIAWLGRYPCTTELLIIKLAEQTSCHTLLLTVRLPHLCTKFLARHARSFTRFTRSGEGMVT